MDEPNAAHLGMIQGVISRMGANSGMMKASAVGLVAGLTALASTLGAMPLLLALLPVALTCWMDAYYLRLERLYRHLYDDVRKDEGRAKVDGPYSMSIAPWLANQPLDVSWKKVLQSPSVWPFYALLAVLVLGASALLCALPPNARV